MDTQVTHLCRPVVTVDKDAPVTEILSNITRENLSSVVVLDKDKKVIGLITENDLLFAETLGVRKKDLKAWQICSKEIIKISPEDTILGAARLMVDRKVHHVLIMVGDYVEGIVSTLDVLKQYVDSE
jgi:acetoin utilization protein AcuB